MAATNSLFLTTSGKFSLVLLNKFFLKRTERLVNVVFYLVSLTAITSCGYASFTASTEIQDANQATAEVPAEASLSTSTIATDSPTVTSNGIDKITITVQLRDQYDNPYTQSGGTLTINAAAGQIGNTTDHGDGTYTATYKPLGKGDIRLTATLNNQPLTNTLDIERTPTTNGFYIHPNGITIKCEDATPGDEGLLALNGDTLITYTKRTRNQLDQLIGNGAGPNGLNQLSTTCTSGITDMHNMFLDKTAFNENITHWDTSNVEDMSGMFDSADAFNQPIGEWDTSKVTDMTGMFYDADEFDQPIGEWDTSNVEYMTFMFFKANAFNEPIGGWNTSNVTDMKGMFHGADAFNRPIGEWDTSNVLDMTGMFDSADAFNQPIGEWDTSNVLDMNYMFHDTKSFDQPIGGWDTTNVKSMGSMFYYADAFNQDISNWCVAEISSEPLLFDDNTSSAWTQKPSWGKCP